MCIILTENNNRIGLSLIIIRSSDNNRGSLTVCWYISIRSYNEISFNTVEKPY